MQHVCAVIDRCETPSDAHVLISCFVSGGLDFYRRYKQKVGPMVLYFVPDYTCCLLLSSHRDSFSTHVKREKPLLSVAFLNVLY